MQKLEFLNLEPKMPYLGVLGSNFEKPLSSLKSAPSKLSYCNVWCKKQNPFNLKPNIPDLHTLGLKFENIIVIFEIGTVEFV